MARLVALILLVTAAAQQGSAIKCYQCNSRTNEACKEPSMAPEGDLLPLQCLPNMAWSPKNLRDAMPGTFSKMADGMGTAFAKVASSVDMFCMKTNIRSGDEMVTLRHCAAAPQQQQQQQQQQQVTERGAAVCEQVRRATDGKAEYCGVCDTDGCNAAPATLRLALSLVALVPLLILLP